ncbi:MAG: hypothetical protein WBP81_38690, partial [Solirubrobacteraceae bacterium]
IGLRRSRHGIEEIVAELERAGTPLSRTAVWEILKEAGLSRMPRPAAKPNGEGEPERLSVDDVHRGELGVGDFDALTYSPGSRRA